MKKNLKFSFDVSDLTDYVKEGQFEIMTDILLKSKTASYFGYVTGLKGKTTLDWIENDVVINAASCGFTPEGTVAFKQREVTVTDLEVKDAMCFEDLNKKWMRELQKPGYNDFNGEIAPIIVKSYNDAIQKQLEISYWQGGQGTPEIGQFDGLITILSAEATRVDLTQNSPNVVSGPFTTSNILAAVDAMILGIPDEIAEREDLVLCMSSATYRTYIMALVNANLYNYKAETGANFEYMIPGTNVTAVAIPGLTGTSHLLLTFKDNVKVLTDLENEWEKVFFAYVESEDEARYIAKFRAGINVHFPKYCVTNF